LLGNTAFCFCYEKGLSLSKEKEQTRVSREKKRIMKPSVIYHSRRKPSYSYSTIYSLPQVGIIGLPKAGKTTAFRHICNEIDIPAVPNNTEDSIIIESSILRTNYILYDVPFIPCDLNFERFDACVLVLDASMIKDEALAAQNQVKTNKPDAFSVLSDYAMKAIQVQVRLDRNAYRRNRPRKPSDVRSVQ
jgi:hypothetical protein